MSDIAIRAERLSKRYLIGAARVRHDTLRDHLSASARRLLHPWAARPPKEVAIWALRDVSFEIPRGAVVGVLGRNGAGKSTLLKILSRITEPTEGRAEIYGRVGSLLEVGTGFHPELTGRENIYLNGTILGMRRSEIDANLDAIVAFAEIPRFIDTPVKRYSSGMYVRLAFAVAAHLNPEILIVDEVLAVGDAAFQRKCLGKMGEVAREGRTVLFVSHNAAAVQQLTQTSILLEEGTVTRTGPTPDVLDYYLKTLIGRSAAPRDLAHAPRPYHDLSRRVEFASIAFAGETRGLFPADADICLDCTVRARESTDGLRFTATVFQLDGSAVGTVFGPPLYSVSRGEVATFRLCLPDLRLAPGMYYLGLATGEGTHQTGHRDFDVVVDVLHFEVMSPDGVDGTRAAWSPGWGRVRFPALKVERMP